MFSAFMEVFVSLFCFELYVRKWLHFRPAPAPGAGQRVACLGTSLPVLHSMAVKQLKER